MLNLDIAKCELKEKKYTCVVVKHGEIVSVSNERGIKPIFSMLEKSKEILLSASLADKVIGKAAALLLVLGNIEEVYADVISEDALRVLRENNVYAEYTKKAVMIINREGTGRCPMEELVHSVNEPKDAFVLINEKLKEMEGM